MRRLDHRAIVAIRSTASAARVAIKPSFSKAHIVATSTSRRGEGDKVSPGGKFAVAAAYYAGC